MENAKFRDCTFEKMDDNSSLFTSAEFTGGSFEKCRLDNSSFYYAHLSKVLFKDDRLENVVLANTVMENIDFDNGSIDFCSFNESNVRKIAFKQVASKGITFGKAVMSDLSLTECDKFAGLNLINATCSTLMIASSKLVSEPTFYQSKITGLDIHDCNVAYLDLVESEITGNSKITNSNISGANMSQAKVTGMVIESSAFDDYLVLDDAVFENLRLQDVTYDAKLEIKAANVQYVNSNRFPAP